LSRAHRGAESFGDAVIRRFDRQSLGLSDLFRQAASYVDKILKGTKPADLLIEQPSKFGLVINLKAASALGLTIGREFQLRADEIIE
jgi:putative tryptophan/tyrosine transport system substrate-binding protein